MTESTDRFEQNLSHRLRESAAQLDAATQSRLTRARHEALARMESPVTRWSRGGFLAAAGLAAVAVLAVGLWRNEPLRKPAVTQNDAVVLSAPDLELLLADESLEMLEDLEFYAWIDVEDFDVETNG